MPADCVNGWKRSVFQVVPRCCWSAVWNRDRRRCHEPGQRSATSLNQDSLETVVGSIIDRGNCKPPIEIRLGTTLRPANRAMPSSETRSYNMAAYVRCQRVESQESANRLLSGNHDGAGQLALADDALCATQLIENGISEAVHSIHIDALSSMVGLK